MSDINKTQTLTATGNGHYNVVITSRKQEKTIYCTTFMAIITVLKQRQMFILGSGTSLASSHSSDRWTSVQWWAQFR